VPPETITFLARKTQTSRKRAASFEIDPRLMRSTKLGTSFENLRIDSVVP